MAFEPTPAGAEAKEGSRPAELNRSERTSLAVAAGLAAVLMLSAVASGGCWRDSQALVARRILEDYRKQASVRPLPPAGSIRVRLSPAGPDGESGSAQIEWAGPGYRETVSSAGFSTVRGIQAGRAFFTDVDGVTRVGSEPMLAELLTRSYFWRRAFLFEDRERATLSLGSADAATVSIHLRPLGGNDLLLAFDRRTSALKSVVSPRFRLEFDGPESYRDLSRLPVRADITWSGLPTRRLPDAQAGGWRGAFSRPAVEAEFSQGGGGIWIPARLGGATARLALDADATGPLRVSTDLARKAGLTGRRDVFGRVLAAGGTLQIGELTMSPLCVQIGETDADGIDAVAGGVLYRETVLEIDPAARRLRLHDPARWVVPEGFGRSPLDDDGDLPVAILSRSGRRVRLRAGTPSATALRLPTTAEGGLAPAAPALEGLVWGSFRLPPLPVRREPSLFDPAWGDDGAIGYPLLLEFHVVADMPHRWVYLKPRNR